MSTATTLKENITSKISTFTRRNQKLQWRWYHGLAFYVVSQVVTFGLAGLVSFARGNEIRNIRNTMIGDVPYFNSLKQSKITPPSWAFGPVWTINNVFQIYGLLRVLNKPSATEGRETYLKLQAATWINFTIFNAVHFSLRSPINAFLFTLSFFALTIASGCVALFQLKDTKLALSLTTLFLWLIIALSASTTQALWNRDDLYQVGPLVNAPTTLIKK